MSEPDPKLLAEMREWMRGPKGFIHSRAHYPEQPVAIGTMFVGPYPMTEADGIARRDLVLLMARSWEALRAIAIAAAQSRKGSIGAMDNVYVCQLDRRAVDKALAMARGEEEGGTDAGLA